MIVYITENRYNFIAEYVRQTLRSRNRWIWFSLFTPNKIIAVTDYQIPSIPGLSSSQRPIKQTPINLGCYHGLPDVLDSPELPVKMCTIPKIFSIHLFCNKQVECFCHQIQIKFTLNYFNFFQKWEINFCLDKMLFFQMPRKTIITRDIRNRIIKSNWPC